MNRFWTKKKIIGLIIVIALIAGYFLFTQEEEGVYTTEFAVKNDVSQIVSVTGTVESNAKIDLRFQQGGKVSKINAKTGQQAETGTTLASLDNDQLRIETDKAKAGYDIALAELNLEKTGASQEEIRISEIKIQEAEVILTNSQKELNDIKLANTEKIKKAELEKENAELTVENARKDYENALASGENTGEQAETDLENAYKNSKTAIIDTIDLVGNAIILADSFLGKDDKRINYQFEDVYRSAPVETRVDTNNAYEETKDLRDELQDDYDKEKNNWAEGEDSKENIEAMLTLADSAIAEAKFTLDQIDGIIEDYDENMSTALEEDLETLTDEITAKQSTLTDGLEAVQTLEQTINNAKLGISSSGISTESEVDKAHAVLEDAEKKLEIADIQLEETKLQAQIDENKAEMQIDVNEVLLEQARANHADLIAGPRYVDIAAMEAKVAREQAAYNQALNSLEDAEIIAPASGLITDIKVEIGENVTASDDIIVLMTDDLQITANVSETDIAKVNSDDKVEITFDAFPLSRIFHGTIMDIDPAETVIQGVIYYETTILFDAEDADIRPGMTANLDILTDSSEDVITVSPQAINYEDDKPFIYILENNQKVKKEVKLGLEGEDSIEIISGIKEGDEVILYENNK